MARRHVTVVLSGDGGDELFGGYDRYLPHPRVARFDSMPVPPAGGAARAAWPLLPHGTRGKNFLRHVAQDAARPIRRLGHVLPGGRGRRAAARRDVRARWRPAPEGALFPAPFDRFAALPWPSQMMRVDFETYLPEDILTKVDRMSMAHSIESRVPLLDTRSSTFAASLPSAMKIDGGRRKRVLKRAAAACCRRRFSTRRKQGFGDSDRRMVPRSLTDASRTRCESPRARQRGYFEGRSSIGSLQEHLSGRRDHTLRLWQLLMFELWHRRYLDAAGSSGAAEESSLPHDSAALPESGNHEAARRPAATVSARI